MINSLVVNIYPQIAIKYLTYYKIKKITSYFY